MPEIEALDVSTMRSLANNIIDQNRDEKLFRQWVSCYPFMVLGTIKNMTFEDYKNRAVIKIDTRPAEEIIAEINEAWGINAKGE